MTKNSPAILGATVLTFLARSLEFQKENDILGSALIAFVFGGISWGLDSFVTRLVKSGAATPLSAQWTPHLLFGWIASLVIVILDSLSNTFVHTISFPQFFMGVVNAVIAYSGLAIIVTFVKTYKFDRGTISSPAAYVICAALLNSTMLYFFIFA